MSEQIETSSKKGRGRARKSLDLIEAMFEIAHEAHPITGRGVGYKLFTSGLIPSMGRSDMQRVYRRSPKLPPTQIARSTWITTPANWHPVKARSPSRMPVAPAPSSAPPAPPALSIE